MGDCKYCFKGAGFFRSKHRECETIHRTNAHKLAAVIEQSLSLPVPSQTLAALLPDPRAGRRLGDAALGHWIRKRIQPVK